MISENISATGLVELVLTDSEGNVKETQVKNLVVSTGLAYIASRMKDATATAMSHMAIGTSTTAASAAQTALISQVGIVALSTITLVTTTTTLDSIQYVATFPAGTPASPAAITEAGLFNAASSGTMLARTTFSVINKGASDVLTITWKVTLA